MAFVVEVVPPTATLFRNVPAAHYDVVNKRASSQAFTDPQMSVNWDQYATPNQYVTDKTAYVTAINCGACRVLGQSVDHAPIQEGEPFGPNQAHTEIRGKKPGSIKNQLRDSAKIVWQRSPDP